MKRPSRLLGSSFDLITRFEWSEPLTCEPRSAAHLTDGARGYRMADCLVVRAIDIEYVPRHERILASNTLGARRLPGWRSRGGDRGCRDRRMRRAHCLRVSRDATDARARAGAGGGIPPVRYFRFLAGVSRL
jgi:hypothetical protein